jgi:hypothetical protein
VRVIAYAICGLLLVPALSPTEVSAQPTSASFSRLQTGPGHDATWQALIPAATEPGWHRLQAMQAELAAAAAGTDKMTATDQQLQTKSGGTVLRKQKA